MIRRRSRVRRPRTASPAWRSAGSCCCRSPRSSRASSSARRSRDRRAFASNLTLWLGMLGAAIAAREGKLLTLATGEFLPKGRISAVAHIVAGADRRDDRDDPRARRRSRSSRATARPADIITAGVPTWVADLALPIGFGLIALRLVLARVAALAGPRASPRSASSPASCSTSTAALLENQSLLPWLVARPRRRASLGAPIFALLGGIALFASLTARQPAGRPADDGLPGADDVDRDRGDSALHARRVPARGRASRRSGCCASSAPGSAGRRAARRSRRRRCARSSRCSPAARASRFSCSAGCCCRRSLGERLSRALLDRPADRVRLARPALSALAAADALRHRVAEGVDRGSLHRRAAAGPADARAARRARRARRAA